MRFVLLLVCAVGCGDGAAGSGDGGDGPSDAVGLRACLRAAAARTVVEAGGRLLALASEAPSLEEVYARYFQRRKEDANARPA